MVGKFGDGEDRGSSKMVAPHSWGCFTCLNVLLVFGGKKTKVPKPQKKSRSAVKSICIWNVLPGYTTGRNLWDISA